MTEDANNLADYITKILIEVHMVNKAIEYFDLSTKEAERIIANNGFVEEYGQCDIEGCKGLISLYSITLKALKKYRTEITGISDEDYEEWIANKVAEIEKRGAKAE